MNSNPDSKQSVLPFLGAGLVLIGVLVFWFTRSPTVKPLKTPTPPPIEKNLDASIQKSCSRCHLFPQPTLFPKSLWPDTIQQMYRYVGMEGKAVDGLMAEQVIAWYTERAPESIPYRPTPNNRDSKLEFRKHGLAPPKAPATPAVSSVTIWPRIDGSGMDLILTDMRHKFLLHIKEPLTSPSFAMIVGSPHPCRFESVDMDGDGNRDFLIANLGSFNPDDHQKGSVSLVRTDSSGQRRHYTLQGRLGRVSDVRAADLDDDGDLDVVVGVFGWHSSGRVLWLENKTEDWNGEGPKFSLHLVDQKHGAIHTPIIDINRDGKMDFLVQLSQEHERVVAYLNQGGGNFAPKTLDQAPHPAWGSNGLTLVDLDGDGDEDALLCNGDSLDGMVLRPSHGIRWLENQGKDWKAHTLAPMYAAHGAKAADIDGDGDLDVVAAAFLPQFDPKKDLLGSNIPSLMWFEQTSPGRFEPWVIERMKCTHPCLDLGDMDGDGDVDIVTGNFTMAIGDFDRLPNWLEIWENPSR